MAEAKSPARTGDPETDEILDELDKEGVPVDPDEETPEPEAKAKGQPEEKEKAEPEPEEETPEEGGEPEDGEALESQSSQKRESVPPSKLKYWREKTEKAEARAQELESEKAKLEADLAEARTAQEAKIIETKLEEVSKKHNVKLELLQDLRATMVDPGLKKDVEEVRKYRAEIEIEQKQDVEFVNDFNANILPIIRADNPDATDEDVQGIFDKVYEKAMAATPDNEFDPKLGRARKSLADYYAESRTLPGRRTGERSRIRSVSGQPTGKKFEELGDGDIDNMSDDEFDKMSEDLGKSSPLLAGGKPKSI